MGIKTVATDDAPRAIGPYSQAVISGGLVFCSGQIPLDPTSMELVGATIEDQTRQVLDNLRAVLIAADSGLDQVLKTTVYLVDMGDFAGMNGVYEQVFGDHRPARAAVEVSALPRRALIEIDAIARRAP